MLHEQFQRERDHLTADGLPLLRHQPGATTTGWAATELWHGLSYITFSYTDLRVDQAGIVAGGTSESPSVAPWARAETATAPKSSSSTLPIRTHPFPAHCEG